MASTIYTFPFEQIGVLLRDMSLSGTAGNMAAIILYTGLSLLPVFVWLVLKKKNKEKRTDFLLFLLSVVTFYVLYYSINPGLFKTSLPGTSGIYLSGVFYSVLVTYGVVRIQNMAMNGGKQTIYRLLIFFLGLLAVLFAAIACMEIVITMPTALENVREAYDTSVAFAEFAGGKSNLNLAVMEAVAVMDSLVEAVPYFLDILIIWSAYKLVKELQKNWYSEESVKASDELAKMTGKTLVVVAILGMVHNILQTLGRNHIADSNLVISIPILSIIFLLAILLAARYIRASQELKTENDLFV